MMKTGKNKLHLEVQKENDHKLNEDALLRLFVNQDDNNKNEISSIEVKSYEEIQKADLPEK